MRTDNSINAGGGAGANRRRERPRALDPHPASKSLTVGVFARLIPAGIHPASRHIKATNPDAERALRLVLAVTLTAPVDEETPLIFNAKLVDLPLELHQRFTKGGALTVMAAEALANKSVRPFPESGGNAWNPVATDAYPWAPDDETKPIFSDAEIAEINDYWRYALTGHTATMTGKTLSDNQNAWKQLHQLIVSSTAGDGPAADRVFLEQTSNAVGTVMGRRAYALLARMSAACGLEEQTGFNLRRAARLEFGLSDVGLFIERQRHTGAADEISGDKQEIEKKKNKERELIANHQKKLIASEFEDDIVAATDLRTSRETYLNASTRVDVAKALFNKHRDCDTTDTFANVAKCGGQVLSSNDAKKNEELVRGQNDAHRNRHYAAIHGAGVAEVGSRNPAADKLIPALDNSSITAQRRLSQIQGHVRLQRLFGLQTTYEIPLTESGTSIIQNAEPAIAGVAKGLRLKRSDVADIPVSGDLDPIPEPQEAQSSYVFLQPRFSDGPVPTDGGAARTVNIWTLSKFRVADKATGSLGHFYPATREELDATWLSAASDDFDKYINILDSFDGITNFGAILGEPNGCAIPRFELTDLDVAPSVDSEISQELGERDQYQMISREQGDDEAKIPAVGTDNNRIDNLQRTTLPSVGFAVLDRRRQVKVVDELVRRKARATSADGRTAQTVILHDASDLTIGQSPDIGMRIRGADGRRLSWRSLVNRIVAYRDPRGDDTSDWIEDLLERLDGGLEARVRVSGTPVSLSSRDGELFSGPNGEARFHALFVDPTVFRWSGDLIGVQTTPTATEIDPTKDLNTTEVHLPLRGTVAGRGYVPPPGRFGMQYWVASRTVYIGGVKIPLGEASARYTNTLDGCLTLPPTKAEVSGRRLLRLERVGAPSIMLDTTITDQYKPESSLYELQASNIAVLRSAYLEPNDDAPKDLRDCDRSTLTTRRILLPPQVSMDFAARHGVFDGLPNSKMVRRTITGGSQIGGNRQEVSQSLPKGGLLNVNQSRTVRVYDEDSPKDSNGRPTKYEDYECGGFPVYTAPEISDKCKKKIKDAKGAEETIKKQLQASGAETAAANFESIGDDFLRRDTREDLLFRYKRFDEKQYFEASQGKFFADPAADTLVLAVKRTLDGSYYKGDPVQIPIGALFDYPNTPAIVLDYYTDNEPNPAKRHFKNRKHSKVIEFRAYKPGLIGRLDANLTFRSGRARPTDIPAVRVPIKLLHGEDVQIEAWFVPSADQLLKWFDIVETAGTLLNCSSNGSTRACADMLRQFADAMGVSASNTTGFLSGNGQDAAPAISVNGHCTLSKKQLRTLANLIRTCALKRPLPELSSPVTMQAVHAVSRPNFDPKILTLKSGDHRRPFEVKDKHLAIGPVADNLAFVRRSWESPADVQDFLEANWRADQWQGDAEQGANTPLGSTIGGEDAVIAARISTDLDTTIDLQLIADVFSAHSELMDNPIRGLTREQRHAMHQMYQDALEKPPGEARQKELDKIKKQLRDSFGFNLDLQGIMVPFRQSVDLGRITDLANDLNLLVNTGEKQVHAGLEGLLLNFLRTGDDADQTELRRSLKRFIFRDTLARRLSNVRLRAGTRFRDYFDVQTCAEILRDDYTSDDCLQWAREFPTRPKNAAFADGPADQAMWIPATSRPSSPELIASLPAFMWEHAAVTRRGERVGLTTPPLLASETEEELEPAQEASLPANPIPLAPATDPRRMVTVERKTFVRVHIKRPWFSSGEGERLGLVLWPPVLFGGAESFDPQQASDQSGDRAAVVPEPINPDLPKGVLNLSDIGLCYDKTDCRSTVPDINQEVNRWTAYVTRWGGDPIRSGPDPTGWYVPRAVFDDLPDGETNPDDDGPILIKDALIPLPADKKGAQAADGSDAAREKSREFFHASILAYKPRFDFENEMWYVDMALDALDIPYPFMRLALVRYQPHAIGHLHASEPVVEWCQLVPRRRVTVSKRKKGAKWQVMVKIEGRGSTSTWPTGFGGQFDHVWDLKPEERPAMRISLRERRAMTFGSQVVVEDSADLAGAGGADAKRTYVPEPFIWDSQRNETGLQETSRRENTGLEWVHKFELDYEPTFPSEAEVEARNSDQAYRFLYIEEVQRMLAANPKSADPQSIDASSLGADPDDTFWPSEKYVQSGPRFSAVVPLWLGDTGQKRGPEED